MFGYWRLPTRRGNGKRGTKGFKSCQGNLRIWKNLEKKKKGKECMWWWVQTRSIFQCELNREMAGFTYYRIQCPLAAKKKMMETATTENTHTLTMLDLFKE